MATKSTKKIVAKKKVAPKKATPRVTAKKTVKKTAVRNNKPKVTAKKTVVKTPVKKTVVKKTPEVQSDLVKKYRSNVKDTGSVAVQIALLTDRINSLAKHLTKHIHDFDSKRGLLILVGKRRRLLNYLRKNNEKAYTKAVKDLKLKK